MEHLLIHSGYAALALLGFLEACCVPIPSEVTFLFGGVLAYQGHLNVVLVIVVGTLAELCGSFVSYYAGRLGGRPVVDRVYPIQEVGAAQERITARDQFGKLVLRVD